MHILAGLIEEWTRAGKETMGRVWDIGLEILLGDLRVHLQRHILQLAENVTQICQCFILLHVRTQTEL